MVESVGLRVGESFLKFGRAWKVGISLATTLTIRLSHIGLW